MTQNTAPLSLLWRELPDVSPDLVASLQERIPQILAALSAELPADNTPEDPWQVTVVISHDAELQELNKQFRGKDKPTNVLAFPDGERWPSGELYLGDVIISYATCAEEARTQGKQVLNHLTHLIVHGLVHLCGYDHLADAEAEEMEALEVRILARLGITNPYND